MKILLEQFDDIEVIKAFNDPKLFLKEAPGLNFDFCFLDIEMPDFNGIQIAKSLKNKPVIFTTAYKEYAAEAFDVNAVDYVRKPITIDRVRQALDKIRQLLVPHLKDETLFFQTDKGRTKLKIQQIALIKSSEIDPRDKIFYLKDGKTCLVKNHSFENISSILPMNEFCRINKKEIISIDAVESFSSDVILTKLMDENRQKLFCNLSQVYRNDFIAKIQ